MTSICYFICAALMLRFFSRESGQFKFQLETALKVPMHGQTSNRRFVEYLFHPSEPFVISLQKAMSDYVVGFHFIHENRVLYIIGGTLKLPDKLNLQDCA